EVVRTHAPNAVLHTDAVQAFPWLDVTSLAAPAQLVAVSAHKFGGPKGVGALVVRDGVTVDMRARTVERVGGLRDRLADGLIAGVPGTRETGDRRTKVAGNCHLRFEGIESEALLILLDDAGVCASAGSACTSGAIEPSHVLTAIGIDAADALSSVRLSLGPTTTDDDVDLALKVVPEAVARLRGR